MDFFMDCLNYRTKLENGMRSDNPENEKFFQQCMKNKKRISRNKFSNVINFETFNDEESVDEYLDCCEMEDDTTGYFKSQLNGEKVVFLQTAGFEIFFK